MDYDVTFRIENKLKPKELSDFTVKLRGFCFFRTSF